MLIRIADGDKFKISEDARNAIYRGIKRGDCVVEMELMGLPQRVINALEESDFEAIYLEELVDLEFDELMALPNIGESAIRQICSILSKYAELERLILIENLNNV